MRGYISFYELVNDYSLNENYLKVAVNRYRNSEQKSWENIKHSLDGRMVLIKIDTIPERTRKKHNIPTAQEYADLQKIREYQAKKDQEEYNYKCYKQALLDAYNNGWLPYLCEYNKIFKDHYNDSLAKAYAQEHAFWFKVYELTGKGYRANRNSLKPIFKMYIELKKEIPFKHNGTLYKTFSKKVTAIRKDLFNNKSITKHIIDNRLLVKHPKKTTSFHRGMAMAYLSHPKMYSYRIVADLINHHAEQHKLETITESWIKKLIRTDKTFKSLIEKYRYGKKNYNDTMSSYMPRKVSPFPANVWMIDGTPMQFYCWNETRTRLIRLYLFSARKKTQISLTSKVFT